MKDPILNPIRINQLKIKNRIYMPAMHLGMADNFHITDQLVDFYAERAKGGAGMITVGYATIDELSGNTQAIGAHSDVFLPGLSRLAKEINQYGTRSAVQLNHSGRYNHSFFLNGKQPVAPSAVASRLTRETPKALEIKEIQNIINRFSQAAGRVQKAGFHAVEILSGTGYLISQFLSPLTNKREDEYGGSLENRMRFGLEIMASIRKTVGPDFPLIVRMNGNDFMPGGQGRLELKKYAKALSDSGNVNALCINVGWHEARVPQIVTSVPRGVFGYLSRGIKEQVPIPVIASHRINDPKTAREMIGDGICDMVALGRSLIADPYLPEKIKSGRENEMIHCIACAQGCFDNLFKLKSVECLCNPRAGHEKETQIVRTDTPKKVMVIGGGAAGMSAALAACERGHQVTLYEKSDRLGGQLYLAAAPPGRAEFAELAEDLTKQIMISSVKTIFHTEVDENLLERETLCDLATQGTKNIILIEMMNKIGQDIGKSTKWCMFQEMERSKIDRRIATKALQITETGVTVEADKKTEEIQADTIVIAAGSKPLNSLADVLAQKGIPFQAAGDADHVAQAIDAIHDGFSAGKNI